MTGGKSKSSSSSSTKTEQVDRRIAATEQAQVATEGSTINTSIVVERVDADLLQDGLARVFGFATETGEVAADIVENALELVEFSNKRALALVGDSTGRALDLAGDTNKRVIEAQAVAGELLEDGLARVFGFATETGQVAADIVEDAFALVEGSNKLAIEAAQDAQGEVGSLKELLKSTTIIVGLGAAAFVLSRRM